VAGAGGGDLGRVREVCLHIDHMQREAGYVRAGNRGRRIGGVEGRWRCLLLIAEGAEGVDAAGVAGGEDAGEQGGEAGEGESRGELGG
jgi:hypothetical protein